MIVDYNKKEKEKTIGINHLFHLDKDAHEKKIIKHVGKQLIMAPLLLLAL